MKTTTTAPCRAIFGEVTTCRHCSEPIHLAAIAEDSSWQVWAHEIAKGCKTGCDIGETVAAP
jgi:hypothetical protein